MEGQLEDYCNDLEETLKGLRVWRLRNIYKAALTSSPTFGDQWNGRGKSKITFDSSETKSDFQVDLYSEMKRKGVPNTWALSIINLLMLV